MAEMSMRHHHRMLSDATISHDTTKVKGDTNLLPAHDGIAEVLLQLQIHNALYSLENYKIQNLNSRLSRAIPT